MKASEQVVAQVLDYRPAADLLVHPAAENGLCRFPEVEFRVQLAAQERFFQRRQAEALMRDGVTKITRYSLQLRRFSAGLEIALMMSWRMRA